MNGRFVEEEEKKEDVWRIKKYLVTARNINIYTGKPIVVLNEREAQENDVYVGYREILKFKNKELIVVVDVAGDDVIPPGTIGVFKDVSESLGIKDGDVIEIVHMNRPRSLEYIKKKMNNKELSEKEMETIINDLMKNRLSEGELGAFVASIYINHLSDSEVVYLTKSIVKSGNTLELNVKPILDKHCIGGVAGNRTTMVLVPIIAAAGFYIPKTSSRAITSAAGTADTMEVLADVDFNIEELKEIVLETKGAIVWGGGLNLASADDKLIKIRKPLGLDPRGLLLASILAKKRSVGSNMIIVDIPIGRGAKIEEIEQAKELARDFINIGKMMNMKIEVLITDGNEPIGNGIGPALEARDVLAVLENKGPEDLMHKSCLLSGKLLELTGKIKKGEGYNVARRLIESGKALKKMKEIIEAQGGEVNISSSDIEIGTYSYDVTAKRNGKINHIDNKKISKIARIAGSPMDKGAGIYLYRTRGDRVKKGDKLFTIYAESETKLSYAVKALEYLQPIEMERILLETVVE